LDKGHGRRERRTITTTTWLNGYLDWPEVGQVFRLTRERTLGDTATVEVAYGITSLLPEQASAKKLLGLVRGHWGIENGLHWVRDVVLGEDRCRVRKGAAAQILATLRNAALYLLTKTRIKSPTAAIRHLAFHPKKAIQLVTQQP
jgi:predicted transposase YbfD/YdcC